MCRVKFFVSLLFVTATLLFGSRSAANGLELEYRIEQTIERNTGGSKTGTQITDRNLVNRTFILGKDAFAFWHNKDEATQVDFGQRRIRYLNHRNHTIRDVSLYPLLCNRDMTMQRHYMIRKELNELKRKFQTNVDSFTLSCMLRLPFPGTSGTDISCVESGKTLTFRHKGRLITTVTFRDQPISESLANSYGKAILYQMELHPVVWKRITERKMVIESLSYDLSMDDSNDPESHQTRRTTMQLLGIASNTSSIRAPETYKIAFSSDSPLYQQQRKVFLRDAPIELPESGKVISETQALIAMKQPLEAFLCLTEFGIEVGDDKPVAMRIIERNLKSEPLIERVEELRAVSNTQEVESALEQLDQFKKKAPLRGYIIEVFKGGIAVRSEARADESFLNALEQNPFLTGTYVDLATYYKSRKRVDLAWDCFDLARQICPGHPILNGATRLERDLADRHPEYF